MNDKFKQVFILFLCVPLFLYFFYHFSMKYSHITISKYFCLIILHRKSYSNYVLFSLFIRMFNNEIHLNFNHVFQLIILDIEASKKFHIYSFVVKWIFKKKTVTQIIIHLSIFVRPSFLYKTYFYLINTIYILF